MLKRPNQVKGGVVWQFINRLTVSYDMLAVRQDVNNLESSVVVQELEFAINLALNCLL